jgi:hypothetical protein
LSDTIWTRPEPPRALVERWQREAERRTGPALTAEQHRTAVWLRAALVRIPARYRPESTQELVGRIGPRLRADAERWTPGTGWLVMGPTAAGKTSAVAYALVRRFAALLSRPTPGPETDAMCGLVWTSAAALVAARSRWPLGRGEAPEVDRATAAPVLVIDDVGWEGDARVLADVLAARYDAGRAVVATTGRPVPELVGLYGPALVRRLMESAPGTIVTDAWPAPGQGRG